MPVVGGRIVVGIDPSLTATGIVVAKSGVMQSSQLVSSGPDIHRPQRLVDLRQGVLACLEGLGSVEVIVMESEVFGMVHQASEQGQVQGVLQVAVFEYLKTRPQGHFLSVNPSVLKKWLGAKGKDEVLLQVYKRYGQEFRDHNLADAFALAVIGEAYASYVLDGKTWPEWTKSHLEVLDKLQATGFPWERAEGPVRKARRPRRSKAIIGSR